MRGCAVNFVSAAICTGGGPGGNGGLHSIGEAADKARESGDVATATALTAKHVAGHALLGGLSQAAMGGRFQDGFLSGAASTFAMDAGLGRMCQGSGPANMLGRTAIAGIVGGTASAVGGGKFANGAFTSAWQHLLNGETRRIKNQDQNGRELTDGEEKLLRENFGGKLDPDKIRVYNFAFLPGARTMTPNGNIYAPGNAYSADYSLEPVEATGGAASQALFIHESTHAWQYQSGVSLKALRLTQPGKHASYNYHPFDPAKKFSDYGIEQQAMLVEDFFKVRNGITSVWNGEAWKSAPSVDQFRRIIKF